MKTLQVSRIAGSRGAWPGRLGKGLGLWLLGVLLAAGLGGQANAYDYDPGALNFSASGQSMWGEGSGLSIDKYMFLGTEWTNATTSISASTGEPIWIPTAAYTFWLGRYAVYQAANPGPAPSATLGRACLPWPLNNTCWDVPNPAYALWWTAYQAYQALDPGPSPQPQYTMVDLTTGANIDLTTSGKVGIEAGFTLSSGTVNATADFAVTAELPDDLTVAANTLFNLSPSSTFASGTIDTQSPWIEAYLNGVVELSGSATAQACLIGACTSGTTVLPTIDSHPELASIDPNKFSLLGGLFETNLAAETLSIDAAFLPPQGVKVSTSGGTLYDSTLPGSATTSLGEISFAFPNISTSGVQVGNKITSTGSDTVIDANLDLDGALTLVSSMAGAPVPLSVDFSLIDTSNIKLEASIDLLDVDVGPTIDMFQNFELTPTLMVDLAFDRPVHIVGNNPAWEAWKSCKDNWEPLGGVCGPEPAEKIDDWMTSYTGAWDSLPFMALLETTTITPTFWLDATLTNSIGVDFGFMLDLAALSGNLTAKIGEFTLLDEASFGPLWSDSIPLGGRFGALNLYDNSFAFTGFNRIAGNAFTLFVADSGAVPEPGTLLLMGVGVAGLMYFLRRAKEDGKR